MGIIHVLSPDEAQKIAAGEVVERPASLVREFIDNAIDAGGSEIGVAVESGGIALIEVSDNGIGMSRDDLLLACTTHATSKITRLEDLDNIRTLGFRGEALAAAAAVARIEILSSTDGKTAAKLESAPNTPPQIIEAARTRGTSVRARGLFDTLPARKRFLKRPASEAALCKQTFIEKALAFPDRSFRWTQDGALKLLLPGVSTYRERFARATLRAGEEAFLHQLAATGDGFTITIVVAGPEITRPTRREQYVFANGRRITDFALQQALEYGVQGSFPNGTHPVAAVFIDIDGTLADFNVHPAKREAHFTCAGALRHAISETLRDYFHHLNLARSAGTARPAHGTATALFPAASPRHNQPQAQQQEDARLEDASTLHSLASGDYTLRPLPSPTRSTTATATRPTADAREQYPHAKSAPADGVSHLRYVGQAFNLFILVEDGGTLYAIDRHAAHERILFDRLLSQPITTQELLTPLVFATDSARDDDFLAREKERFAALGVVLTGGGGTWQITALPAAWKRTDSETVRDILALKDAGENIAERWAATLACHSAIKDGDPLDDDTAFRIAKAALALPVRFCPHGRPILTAVSKDSLLGAVQRTE